ncbi:MAG: hypothetical protein JRJ79_16040 [Deltaproteobacteria bacterium]|nr:hypothetical protein [Deltaproteobacteria bacterium]
MCLRDGLEVEQALEYKKNISLCFEIAYPVRDLAEVEMWRILVVCADFAGQPA